MNREIKFRGKHIHVLPPNKHLDGTWIYGYLCDENYINSPELEGEFLVNPETVCQYTGLTDKNGRKIFEGDIVKIPLFKPNTMVIGFIEGAFCLVNKKKEYVADIHYTHHAGVNQTEVIGNIFDNSELLGSD